MLPEQVLRDILSSLPTTTLYGPWSRAVNAHHLLQAQGSPQPLWPYGSVQVGGRYNPRDGFPTIYLASDLPTAYVEVEGLFAVRDFPSSHTPHPPLVFVTVRGFLSDALDLTDPAVQTSLGTSHQELTGDWWLSQPEGELARTQVLGRAAYDSGRFVGLVAPSSKHPESQIIAVFFDRLVPGQPSRLEVLDPYGHFRQQLP